MRQLRDYQQEDIAAVDKVWAAGQLRVAGIAATGLGKTDLIAFQATRRVLAGQRALILAHRMELLDQIDERCRQWLDRPGLVGFVQGDRNQTSRPITVASVATLRSPKRQRQIRPYGPGDLVIVDECHHAASKSYLDVMRWAGCWDATPALGVTATMYRTARKGPGLGDVWGKAVAFERGLIWAMTHGPDPADRYRTLPVGPNGAPSGWLVRPRCIAVQADHLDLGSVKTARGDYAEGELGEMVSQDADQIVNGWLEHGENRITAGFFPTVAAAKELTCAFERRGVPAELVTGETPLGERGSASLGTGIYGRLARGETRVLCSVMVPTEGFDCPPISCILWGRPTKIDGLLAQGIGRGLRLLDLLLFPGHPPKTDCLVLDVVGVTRVRGLRTPVDLFPGVEYQEPGPPRPCATCGGYTGKYATAQTGPACTCEKRERERQERNALTGPARYTEVDLLAESGILWLATRDGIPFVAAPGVKGREARLGVLWEHKDGTWTALDVSQRGREKARRLVSNVSLEVARARIEAWALAHVGPEYAGMVRKDSPWRRNGLRPNDSQIALAKRLRIDSPERYTRAALSDQISIAFASDRLKVR